MGTPLVVVVNETLARRYWPGQDPIGKRVKGFDSRGAHDDWLTVVGLVGDTRSGGRERAPFSQIYEPLAQTNERLNDLVIRTSSNPDLIARNVRSVIRQVDKGMVVSRLAGMEQLLAAQETQRRFETWLIGLFSGIALALAAVGVFAVMHYSVTARTQEIAIRMALGARAADVLALVLRRGVYLALGGIAVGTLLAIWVGEVIAAMLYGVTASDPASFAIAGFILAAIAVIACYAPAYRASHVDPVTALREQ